MSLGGLPVKNATSSSESDADLPIVEKKMEMDRRGAATRNAEKSRSSRSKHWHWLRNEKSEQRKKRENVADANGVLLRASSNVWTNCTTRRTTEFRPLPRGCALLSTP